MTLKQVRTEVPYRFRRGYPRIIASPERAPIFFHHKRQPVEMGKGEFEQFLFIMKMLTRLTLFPGDRGAKQLQEQYREQLVCACYRYDEQQQKRLKTGELAGGS